MAQLVRMQHGDSSRTEEQHYYADSPSVSNVPRTLEGRMADEDNLQPNRKVSVIAKVKEKAKKWRQNLSRKKHVDGAIEIDPELHGGSSARQRMFGRSSNRSGKNNTKKCGSTTTLPKSYSDIQRGNPSIPWITINDTFRAKSLDRSHSGRAPSPINSRIEDVGVERNASILREKLLHLLATRESEPDEIDEHPNDIAPLTRDSIDNSSIVEKKGKMPILEENTNETGADKSTVNDRIEKLPSLGIRTESEQEQKYPSRRDIHGEEQVSPTTMKTITEAVNGRLSPDYASVSDKGVVEKVRDVSLMRQSEGSPSSSLMKTSESTSSVPESSYAHEVEEDHQGRIPQAN